MAEFTRKSRSRSFLESIDTAKASKKQVYDFYERWRKQYGMKGKGLDFKAVKKADIVRELHKVEAYQEAEVRQAPVKRFERKYERIKEELQAPSQKALESIKKLQKEAARLQKLGKISQAKANILTAATQQPAPRKKTSTKVRTRRQNVYYKGRWAHDYIKKMCDDGLIDSEDFEDSQEIWYTVDLINGNPDDLDFFESHYSGQYKKGSRQYYLGDDGQEKGFEGFMRDSEEFERELAAKNQPIPERRTDEYWEALAAWLRSKEGSISL